MRISIVIGYTGRPEHLLLALRSILATSASAVEVVVVDDGAPVEVAVVNILKPGALRAWARPGGRFTVRILRIDPAVRRHENPCVPYNIGASRASGEVLLLQECSSVHAGDVLGAVERLFSDGLRAYRSFGCYSCGWGRTRAILEGPARIEEDGLALYDLLRAVPPQLEERAARHDLDDAWYNHPVHRPAGYYWAAAVTAALFREVGGFDLRYAHGRAYEDNDLLARLGRNGVPFEVVGEPFVLHLAHDREPFTRLNDVVWRSTSREHLRRANGGVLLPKWFDVGGVVEHPQIVIEKAIDRP